MKEYKLYQFFGVHVSLSNPPKKHIVIVDTEFIFIAKKNQLPIVRHLWCANTHVHGRHQGSNHRL